MLEVIRANFPALYDVPAVEHRPRASAAMCVTIALWRSRHFCLTAHDERCASPVPGGSVTHPSSRSQAGAFFIGADVRNDAAEAAALGLGRGVRVQFGAAVPAEHRIEVASDAEPVHFDDPASVKAGATGLPMVTTPIRADPFITPAPNRHA
jgi:hypothetical protein